MRVFSFSLSFNPLRRLPCLLSAEKPQPCFCVCDAPHPGSPPVFLCTFPQPFFMKCSALPSPAPLFPKLALPVKSLIKKPPCRTTAVTLSCIRIRPANPSPFLSLWPCRFVPPFPLPSFFQIFRPAGFSCVPVPVLLSVFSPLFCPCFRCFLSEFCITVEQLWFALQNAAKKGYTIDNQFLIISFSRSETLWIPTIRPKRAAASG